jgi:hypothetical protein
MKVRVKDGCKGFYGTRLRVGANENKPEGDVFELKAKTHSTKKDEKGKPLVISAEQQFSDKWMERVEVPKKPGPKPKAVE